MKAKNLSNNMTLREQKWHAELNTTFSIIFWEKTRRLCASINFENPLKWLQFQIVRNSLQTNYIVSHFIRSVNPECFYCGLSSETISHLYWFCPIVSDFLKEIFPFICNLGLDFKSTHTQFIFGFRLCR